MKILLAGILLGLIGLGILIACVLPLCLIGMLIAKETVPVLGGLGIGIAVIVFLYIMLIVSQYYYLILDQDVDVGDSLMMSKDLMKGNKLTLFCIGLLSGLIVLVAALPCLLGLLVAGPYFALMYPVIYLTITGQPMADQMQGNQTANPDV